MKIGFIGCGNMGGAIALSVSGADAEILLYDKNIEKALGTKEKIGKKAEISNVDDILRECDLVFLGVKPQVIGEVLQDIGRRYEDQFSLSCFVSMAAGVSLWQIQRELGQRQIPVIRIMPNMPITVSEGMTVWCAGEYVTREQKKIFCEVMSHTGALDELPEGLIDAESALAGCGPAFVYMFIEALADGGVKCGLPRDKAMEYAVNTLIGAARSVEKTGKHPGELKDMVCSPAGSTIDGVKALEDGAFRSTVISAVSAAYERTKELSK